MQIIAHYDDGTVDNSGYGAQIRADVNYVCNLYGGLFTNPVTLNIEISVGNPADGRASNHVGQNYNFDYATIKSHLSANLPDQDPLNGGGNNANYQLSSAQVQALGIPVSEYPAIDDYITVGSLASQSFTIGDNSPNSFVAAVEHELSEGMGRVSDLGTGHFSVMDLFRYTTVNGTVVRDNFAGASLSNATAFFSLDDGATNLGTWNNDPNRGDTPDQVTSGITYDLGDWVPQGPAPNGNDAYGVGGALTLSDLDVMRAIGWDTFYSPNEIPSGVTGWVPAGPDPTGQPYNNLTVFYGGYLDVGSGGESDSDLLLGGTMRIDAGGSSFFTSNTAGSTEFVSGTAYGDTVDNNGDEIIVPNGSAVFTAVNIGGTQHVSGGQSFFTTVNSGGIQIVDPGGLANFTIINSGGDQRVSGTLTNDTPVQLIIGRALSATVYAGGSQTLYLDSTASSTLLSDGVETVLSGALASGTWVGSGGQQNVYGDTSNTTVASAGQEFIFSGGTTHFSEIDLSGEAIAYNGGLAKYSSVTNGGAVIVSDGGEADFTTVSNGGEQTVYSGGKASSTFVAGGGLEYVNGGTASATAVAGRQEINFGGTAVSASIDNGGRQDVEQRGIATYTSVYAGGEQNVSGLPPFLTDQAFYASAISATLSGGIQNVLLDGVATGTMVAGGGLTATLVRHPVGSVPIGVPNQVASHTGSALDHRHR
jgi:autotransporter passenger strand-loop-strand repeat protein